MRKLLWLGGPLPVGMTQEKYDYTAKQLSLSIGGELVRFGDNSWVIIGDAAAERRYNALMAESVAADKITA